MRDKDRKIGEIIKDWIKVAGYTQEGLAGDLEISRITFSAQLNGRKSMPIERINTLVEWFNPPDEDLKKIKSLIAQDALSGLNFPGSTDEHGLTLTGTGTRKGIGVTFLINDAVLHPLMDNVDVVGKKINNK